MADRRERTPRRVEYTSKLNQYPGPDLRLVAVDVLAQRRPDIIRVDIQELEVASQEEELPSPIAVWTIKENLAGKTVREAVSKTNEFLMLKTAFDIRGVAKVLAGLSLGSPIFPTMKDCQWQDEMKKKVEALYWQNIGSGLEAHLASAHEQLAVIFETRSQNEFVHQESEKPNYLDLNMRIIKIQENVETIRSRVKNILGDLPSITVEEIYSLVEKLVDRSLQQGVQLEMISDNELFDLQSKRKKRGRPKKTPK